MSTSTIPFEMAWRHRDEICWTLRLKYSTKTEKIFIKNNEIFIHKYYLLKLFIQNNLPFLHLNWNLRFQWHFVSAVLSYINIVIY